MARSAPPKIILARECRDREDVGMMSCALCGKPFQGRNDRSKYCSRECSQKSRAFEDKARECFDRGLSSQQAERETGCSNFTIFRWYKLFADKLPDVKKACANCGRQFTDDSQGHHQRMCSEACAKVAYKKAQKRRKRKAYARNCAYCEAAFITHSPATTACSISCSQRLISKAHASMDELLECFRQGVGTVATSKKTGVPPPTVSRWFAKFRQEATENLVATAGTVIGDDSSVITDPAAIKDLMEQLLTGRLVGDQDGRVHGFGIDA